MSNGDLKDIKARLFDLNSKVLELVREGKRDPRWIADIFQGIVSDNLPNLKLYREIGLIGIKEHIPIHCKPFFQGLFFRDMVSEWGGRVKFCIDNRFRRWILEASPSRISEFKAILSSFQLSEMKDSVLIYEGLARPNPFTEQEMLAVIKFLVKMQPRGEQGFLSVDTTNAFFSVWAEGHTTCVVSVEWESSSSDDYWVLRADEFLGKNLGKGSRIFCPRFY